MPTNWRVYGNETVAAKLGKADIPGFLRKQIVVGPTEAAVVVIDGVPTEAITQAAFEVAGLWDRLKSLFNRGEDIEVIFVDITPFDLAFYIGENVRQGSAATTVAASALSSESFTGGAAKPPISAGGVAVSAPWSASYGRLAAASERSIDASRVVITAISRDNEPVTAECRLRVSVPIANTMAMAGLLKSRPAVARWDVAAIVRDEMVAKVLRPLVAQHDASDLRRDRTVLDQLEAATRTQLDRLFQDWGLQLHSVNVMWGLTESDTEAIARRRAEREDAATAFQHRRGLDDMKRQLEVQRTRLANDQELESLRGRNEIELAELYDAAEGRQRVNRQQIELDIRRVQLAIEQEEARAILAVERDREFQRLDVQDREWRQQHEARLASIDASDKEMASMVRLQIQMASAKHEREMQSRRQDLDAAFRQRQQDVEDRFQQRKLKLEESLARMGMMERVLSQGFAAGAADASVLRTMLEQSTEQEYATGTDAKVAAREQAKAAARSLDVLKEAEDRERANQRRMTDLASSMMASAKQPPASTVVVGPVSPGGAPAPVVQVGVGSTLAATSCCVACGGAIQAGWKACPHCGAATSRSCAGCGQALQPAWKVCPACGKPAAVGS